MIGPSAQRILVFAMVLAVCIMASARRVCAEIVCADDIVPEGMAVTATGTSSSCAGACRARKTQAVCGPVMKICAGQPVPKGYVVDSVTTVPACQCLSPEDNAYVIRYVGPGQQADLLNESESAIDNSPYVDSQDHDRASSQVRYPYGDPPFGNLLCATSPMGPGPYSNSPSNLSSQFNNTNPNGQQVPSGGQPLQPASQPYWGYQQPSWNYAPSEPFRVGQ